MRGRAHHARRQLHAIGEIDAEVARDPHALGREAVAARLRPRPCRAVHEIDGCPGGGEIAGGRRSGRPCSDDENAHGSQTFAGRPDFP
jgi:hypothetical protein